MKFFSLLSIIFLAMSVGAAAEDIPVPVPASPPLASSAPEAARADTTTDVGEALDEAKAAYRNKQYKEALRQVSLAQNAIRAKHAQLYQALLPDAPKGWQIAGEGNSNTTLSAGVLGGGSVVKRQYTANGHMVSLGFVIDSPTIALVNSMVQTVVCEPEAGGSNMVLITDHVLVGASSPTRDKNALRMFLGLVDFEALRKLDY